MKEHREEKELGGSTGCCGCECNSLRGGKLKCLIIIDLINFIACIIIFLALGVLLDLFDEYARVRALLYFI